jgi:ribosomal protein S18 acetylase RimI-like enzyme
MISHLDASPGSSVSVRQLGVTDAPRYRALRLAGLRAFPHAFRSDYEQALTQPPAWAEKRLATPGDIFFGAFNGEELVGAVCLRLQDGKKIRHAAELKALVVDPNAQARGIGSTLVAHLIGHARSLGYVRHITLTVHDGNTRAERLYDAFGFKQFGFEPDAFLYEGKYCAKQYRQLFLESQSQ